MLTKPAVRYRLPSDFIVDSTTGRTNANQEAKDTSDKTSDPKCAELFTAVLEHAKDGASFEEERCRSKHKGGEKVGVVSEIHRGAIDNRQSSFNDDGMRGCGD